MTEMRRFEPREVCAIEPGAFGMLIMAPSIPEPSIQDGIATLYVRGPLDHHRHPLFQSYESILDDARAIMESTPRAVVMRIDSPGGLVSGCFEAATELRAIFGGTPVYAYVEGKATSAAYALACIANEIVVAPSGCVGSIGVINPLVDETSRDEREGVRWHFVTSGARKADGHPHAGVGDAVLERTQAMVDQFAEMFFTHVATYRPALTVDTLRAFEAGVFHGDKSTGVKLADAVETFPKFIARISAGENPPAAADASAQPEVTAMADTNEDVVEKLRKMAESDDEEMAKKAKKALAAFEDDDEKKDESEAKAKAEDSEDEKKDESEAKASSEGATIVALTAKLAKLEAAMAAKAEAEERQALLASRPDLPAETVAWLKSQPLAVVRGALESIPKIPGRAQSLAATAVVSGTRGASQADDSAPRLPPEAKAELDAKMGLLQTEAAVVTKGNKLILGARVPVGKDA